MKLNLGCGLEFLEDFVNVDNNAFIKADVRHDLNIRPYSFPDNTFSEIRANHIIEHLNDPINFLEEIYRIGKNNALVTISCPHFSCNWIHPRHRSAISSKLFNFVDNSMSEYYGGVNYKVEEIKLKWLRHTDRGKRKKLFLRVLNALFTFLGNLNPAASERIWCYLAGGFEEIQFKARIIKS